jgi:chromosome segregation ATPase
VVLAAEVKSVPEAKPAQAASAAVAGGSKRRKTDSGLPARMKPAVPRQAAAAADSKVQTRGESIKRGGHGAAGNTLAGMQAEVAALRQKEKITKKEAEAAGKEREALQKQVKQLTAALAAADGNAEDGPVYMRLQAQQRRAAALELERDDARLQQDEVQMTLATEREHFRAQDETTAEALTETAKLKAKLAELQTSQNRAIDQAGAVAASAAAVELAELRAHLRAAEQARAEAAAEVAVWRNRVEEDARARGATAARLVEAEQGQRQAEAGLGAAEAAVEQLRAERGALRGESGEAVAEAARTSASLAAATGRLDRLEAETAAALALQRGWCRRRDRRSLRLLRADWAAMLAGRVGAVARLAEENKVKLESALEELQCQLEEAQAGRADPEAAAARAAAHAAELTAAQEEAARASNRLQEQEARSSRDEERLMSNLDAARERAAAESNQRADDAAEHQRLVARLSAELAATTAELRRAVDSGSQSQQQTFSEREALRQLQRAEVASVERKVEDGRAAASKLQAQLADEQRRRGEAEAARAAARAGEAAAGKQVAELRLTVKGLRAELLDATEAKAALEAEQGGRATASDAACEQQRREWLLERRENARLQAALLAKDTKIAQLRTMTTAAAAARSPTRARSPGRARAAGSPRRTASPRRMAPAPASARTAGSPRRSASPGRMVPRASPRPASPRRDTSDFAGSLGAPRRQRRDCCVYSRDARMYRRSDAPGPSGGWESPGGSPHRPASPRRQEPWEESPRRGRKSAWEESPRRRSLSSGRLVHRPNISKVILLCCFPMTVVSLI